MNCEECGGTGFSKEVSVTKLNNQGLYQVADPKNLTEGGLFQEEMLCPTCEGTGKHLNTTGYHVDGKSW